MATGAGSVVSWRLDVPPGGRRTAARGPFPDHSGPDPGHAHVLTARQAHRAALLLILAAFRAIRDHP